MKTAEDFLLDIVTDNRNSFDLEIDWQITSDVTKAMIEFAKMHVKAALEVADAQAEYLLPGNIWDLLDDVNFITQIYPESNIK